MAPFRFKPQQQLALDYPGNIAVSAGAGSGKTRVLVEKYFRMLVHEHPNWPVDSVVAITFTVKAAGELRSRIVRRIQEELAEPELSEATRARLLEIRYELAGAPIGTIHNFCSRLLREFAFEARLNPDFQIVEGARESSLRRDAVEAAVSLASEDPQNQLYFDLLVLLSLYSRGHLYRMLEGMLKRRSEFSAPVERYTGTSIDELFEQLVSYQAELASELRTKLIHDLREALLLLNRLDPAGDAGRQAESLVARLQPLMSPATPWQDLCSLAGDVQKALFTQKGELLSKIEKQSAVKRGDEILQHLWNLCCDCSSTALKMPGPEDRENLEASAMLARLYQQAEALYAHSRGAAANVEEVDLLDFTDLEILADRLISKHVRVRNRLRERIKYLIVDEFQDTSEIQWRILGPVVSGEDGNLLPGRFFMVGDPKQGVYGFRQASTRVFNHVRQLVVDSNPDGDCRGAISINYNFRTLPRPLNIVNDLFSSLMQSQEKRFEEVVFESLLPERGDAEGAFSLLVARAQADVAEEAPAVEDHEVQLVVQRVSDYLTGEDGRKRAPGDIAILLRKRKHFEAYERALRTRGIPYVTHRGKGLYEQPEALALLSILRLLSQPNSDILAAEVARGPLLNFTDDLLLKISLVPGRSFLEKCLSAEDGSFPKAETAQLEFTSWERERIHQLGRIYRVLSENVGLQEVDSLITLAVEISGAGAIFSIGKRGAQAMANLRRLIEIARQMKTNDLDEFLDYIDSEVYDSGGQAESNDDADGGAVRIMTIHAAKGLEFPVVFLPELADPIQVQRESVLSDGDKWMAVRKALSAAKEDLFLPAHLEEIKLQRAAGEEKRVLYVAMTRCRDELVLSCTTGGRREKESFYGWIAPELQRLGLSAQEGCSLEQQEEPPDTAVQTVVLHDRLFVEKLAGCSAVARGLFDVHRDNGSPFMPTLLENPGACLLSDKYSDLYWLPDIQFLGHRILRALRLDSPEQARRTLDLQLHRIAIPRSHADAVGTSLIQTLEKVQEHVELWTMLQSNRVLVAPTVTLPSHSGPREFQPDLLLEKLGLETSVYIIWIPAMGEWIRALATAHRPTTIAGARVLIFDPENSSMVES